MYVLPLIDILELADWIEFNLRYLVELFLV